MKGGKPQPSPVETDTCAGDVERFGSLYDMGVVGRDPSHRCRCDPTAPRVAGRRTELLDPLKKRLS